MFFIMVFGSTGSAAGTEILGLRVCANDDEYLPPIIGMNEFITIEFDVLSAHPPDYQIIFSHCSRNWVPDRSLFLQDEGRDRSAWLQYAAAPAGIRSYTFHYKNSFPDKLGQVRFLYSGNYRFFIVKKGNENEILEEGRFVLAEKLVSAVMTVNNKYYSESSAPLDKRHHIAVSVSVPGSGKLQENTLFHPNISTVDIYQNRKLYHPVRIDVNDRSPDTFVEDFTQPNKNFVVRNVLPGNEYRRLDISSVRWYPNGSDVRLTSGADLSREYWQGTMDMNGAAKIRPYSGQSGEFMKVHFRFKPVKEFKAQLFLTGAWNRWQIKPEWEMVYDQQSREYVLDQSVRRGVYDYQYVAGEGTAPEHWCEAEGNDWRTINRYVAVVYYRDERFGGFDRVVGTAVAKSPGGNEETHNNY